MKKLIAALATVAAFSAQAAETLTVAATAVPHAELLEFVKPQLAEQGVTLNVKVFTDYVQPNIQVAEKRLDPGRPGADQHQLRAGSQAEPDPGRPGDRGQRLAIREHSGRPSGQQGQRCHAETGCRAAQRGSTPVHRGKVQGCRRSGLLSLTAQPASETPPRRGFSFSQAALVGFRPLQAAAPISSLSAASASRAGPLPPHAPAHRPGAPRHGNPAYSAGRTRRRPSPDIARRA